MKTDESSSKSADFQRRIDQVCEAFESAWREGEPTSIEHLLAELGPTRATSTASLLRELIAVEIDLRRELGEIPDRDEYLSRFAAHKETVNEAFQEVGTAPVPGRPQVVPEQHVVDPRAIPGYEILTELGRGASGVVYKARDRRLERLVAVKVILSGAHLSSEELGRFRAEAVTVAKLQHPGIVQVFEVGEFHDTPYLVLELVEGGVLSQYASRTAQPIRWTAEIVEQLARAVHYAHERGVVHRDLKPANVLLTSPTLGARVSTSTESRSTSGENGSWAGGAIVPKITDFGLAKQLDAVDQRTRSGTLVGTPSYMSPEQASGNARSAGAASDVYSLGAILYELVVGRPPFQTGDFWETLRMVREEDPEPPRRIRLDMPADLETICLKCLAKEPSKRYATAEALADDLRRFQSAEPIAARPRGPVERTIRWARRYPSHAALLGMAFLGVTAILWFWQSAERARSQAEKNAADVTESRDRLAEALRDADLQRDLAQEEEQRAERFAGYALRHANQAQRERDLAEQQWRLATASGLAAHSLAQRDVDPSLSLLLAGEAAEFTRDAGQGVLPIAYEALVGSLANAGGTPLGREDRPVRRFTFVAQQPNWFLTSAWDRPPRLWRLDANGACDSHPLLKTYGVINEFSISPDANWLAVASGIENEVRLVKLDPPEQNLLLELGEADFAELEHPFVLPTQQRVAEIKFSADSRWVTMREINRRVTLWSLESQPPRGVMQEALAADGVLHMELQAPARHLVFLRNGRLEFHSLASGATLREEIEEAINEFPVSKFTLSQDGRYLAVINDQPYVYVWDLDASDPAAAAVFKAQHHNAVSVQFSPDGQWLTSGGLVGTLKAWRFRDGSSQEPVPFLLSHRGPITQMAFDSEKNLLATIAGGDLKICVWNLNDENLPLKPAVLRGHSVGAKSIAFMPEGRLLSSDELGEVRLWEPGDVLTGGSFSSVFAHRARIEVHGVACSKNGLVVSSAVDGTLVVWNATAPKLMTRLANIPVRVMGVSFSRDGRWLAAGGAFGTCHIWDTHHENLAASRRDFGGHSGAINAVSFDPSGERIATASSDGTIRIFDLASGDTYRVLDAQGGVVWDVAFSPDGTHIVSGHKDRRACLWNLSAREGGDAPLVLPHPGVIRAVAFGPDGRRVASGSRNGTIRLWEIESPQLRDAWTSLEGHNRRVLDLDFSADGRWLASSSLDATARLWDLTADDPNLSVVVLPNGGVPVPAIAFHPNGGELFTGTDAGLVRRLPLDIDVLLAEAMRIAGRQLTTGERARFLDESLTSQESRDVGRN